MTVRRSKQLNLRKYIEQDGTLTHSVTVKSGDFGVFKEAYVDVLTNGLQRSK